METEDTKEKGMSEKMRESMNNSAPFKSKDIHATQMKPDVCKNCYLLAECIELNPSFNELVEFTQNMLKKTADRKQLPGEDYLTPCVSN